MKLEEIKKYELPTATLTPMIQMTDAELEANRGGTLIFDIECFRNYFLILFMDFASGKVVTFERTNEFDFDRQKLTWLISNYRIVGFNSWMYDEPMLWASLHGLWPTQLKTLSDQLICQERFSRAMAEKDWGFKIGFSNHIDILNVLPSSKFTSLKQYGGRIHVPRLQDLPLDPQQDLTADEIFIIRHYCYDDCVTTAHLFSKLQDPVKLREEMGLNYGLDLRSRSDAQIAERVIKEEIESISGLKVNRPRRTPGERLQYQVPGFVQFHTPIMQNALSVIRETVFELDKTGKPIMPPTIRKMIIPIGTSVYNMGMGGLHSKEKKRAHFADKDTLLLDRDVASYYPQIILNQGLFPKHLGEAFLNVYDDLVRRRLIAKAAKDKPTADSLKITINGAFGKLGSHYSCLYAPELLLQVTLTGQLALLMLIEMLEICNIRVVSANTDGIVIKCSVGKEAHLNQIVAAWEEITDFVTEETRYKALYSRDVNNYIAIGADGDFKAKGSFVCGLSMKNPNREQLMKNPEFEICNEAVMLFLRDGISIEKTIRGSWEMHKFLAVRKVTGGAAKDKLYLGKSIRWYMRFNEFGAIQRVVNGNTVPNTTGGYPMMTLTGIAGDIDYDWYVKRSLGILNDIGFNSKNEIQRELF